MSRWEYDEDGLVVGRAAPRQPDFYIDESEWYVYKTLEEAKSRGCTEADLTPVWRKP